MLLKAYFQISRDTEYPERDYSITLQKQRVLEILKKEVNSGRVGTLHMSPKFYDDVFLFVGLITLETSIEIWLDGS